MGFENLSDEIVFLSYLDEENNKREGYFKIIHFDSSFCKFETKGNILIIPACRILKIKYKKEIDDGDSKENP
jgi:hypothetical protein